MNPEDIQIAGTAISAGAAGYIVAQIEIVVTSVWRMIQDRRSSS